MFEPERSRVEQTAVSSLPTNIDTELRRKVLMLTGVRSTIVLDRRPEPAAMARFRQLPGSWIRVVDLTDGAVLVEAFNPLDPCHVNLPDELRAMATDQCAELQRLRTLT
jgi:hypothetical protein